jgi:hypothetical protein
MQIAKNATNSLFANKIDNNSINSIQAINNDRRYQKDHQYWVRKSVQNMEIHKFKNFRGDRKINKW